MQAGQGQGQGQGLVCPLSNMDEGHRHISQSI